MASFTSEWKPNGRPTSTIVMNFSAALDDIFNLSPTAELASHIEKKKVEVKTREQQLQELDARLRQANEQLKKLESRHRRMQSENILSSRARTRDQYNSSDSEGQSSNASDTDRQ